MATLLIIEDSARQRDAVRSVVMEAGVFDEVLTAEDGIRGLRMLLEEGPDVVLCDLEMPGLNGDKLLHVRASRADLANVPFIFLTGTEDVHRRARLLADGACDAIAKPFHPADLLARLQLHLRVKELQDQLLEKNALLERLSTTDSLTGLCTRRVAEEALETEMKRARRHRSPLSVFMADLDRFKLVNDRYGHTVGDTVLRTAADLLQQAVRVSDVIARYGGEEVIAVLPQTPPDGAAVVAERWRESLENTPFVAQDGFEFTVTVSVGVAGFVPPTLSAEEFVSKADRALYRAKDGGRNRVEIAPDEEA